MASYLIISDEQELRTLNTAVLTIRKWLRQQNQALKYLSDASSLSVSECDNLLKRLIKEAKKKQETVDILLKKGQSFLFQHANLVLEVELENLVFLWNSYVERLRKLKFPLTNSEVKAVIKVDCKCTGSGDSDKRLKPGTTVSHTTQESIADISNSTDSISGSDTSLENHKGQLSVNEKDCSYSIEDDSLYNSFYDSISETSVCLTHEDLDHKATSLNSTELACGTNTDKKKGRLDSAESSLLESGSEAVYSHEFQYNDDHGQSACDLEDSSDDDEGYVFAIDSGVFASFLPAYTEKMETEKSKKALNVASRDMENYCSHSGQAQASIKKGLSNSPSHCELFGATENDACPDVGSLITFDIPGLKVTEVIGGDIPSDAKRRRMLLDTQQNTSNFSSRSESPTSMESSRSETPTGTLTRAERQNELWRAIGSIDTFLMDKDIVEACKSTASDLSCEDDDFAGAPNVSFAEFLQQYKELTDWLNQVNKVTQREVTSLSEKYLNQSYHEEMLERSPRREFLNSYSHQLLLRYPNMADQISARMARLNGQWSTLEQTIAPKHGRHDADTMLQDLESDLGTLRRWLNAIEARLLPLTISAGWTDAELEDKLHRHQALQRDIESHNKIVNAVLKLSERLEHDSQASGNKRERDSFQLVALNLERRWHGIWLQSLEWQCRLEEAISRRKGSSQSGFDFSRFSLPVLDESLFSNSSHDLRDQSLIELDDDSLLFIGHRDDFEDSTGTSTDDEQRSFDLSAAGRPGSSASESRIFHFDYVDSEAQTSSDTDSIIYSSYADRNSRSRADIFTETENSCRPFALFKPDSPLGKRPFPDCLSGEASPAKKGSQSPSSPSGGLSPVVQGNILDSFINSRGLYINSKRGLLIDSLYEDSDHAFLKTHKSLLDRSSGDSANISETESKMGDSPPSNNLLSDSPEHLGGYAITSSDGEEDPPVLRSGSKTEAKDIGYSSESQSNDEVEVMHHQIDMEYKYPGKCEVASDGPLGDKVTLPSVAIRSAYYCMTLVDIDSTDRTDNGDTTDSGGERVTEAFAQTEHKRNSHQSDIIKTSPDEDYSDIKVYKDSDSLDDSWDPSNFPSPIILGGHSMEKDNTHSAAEQLLMQNDCNGLTPMHELVEFSESDSAPESRNKKSIRYLIEHAEDLVKPSSPKHSNSLSPSKQMQTLTSPSKHTQTESCSTVESSCDASGEDNSEYEGLKAGSIGEGFSTATDDADETLFNSVINLESATESVKNLSPNDFTFPHENPSQVYDSARLRKQTGGNPQQRGRKDRPWSVVGLEDVLTSKKSDNLHHIVAASESAIDYLHFHTDTDSPSQFFTFSHSSTFPRDSHSGNIRRAYSTLEHTSVSKSARRKLKYSHTANSTVNSSFTNSVPQLEDTIATEGSIGSTNLPTTTKLPYSESSSGTSPRKNHRSRRLRRRSSLEKKTVSNAGSSSTTDSYNSAEAESESEATDEYLTAPLEVATSDVEDVHNVSGSLSENSTWDNYQMLYPTASEDPGEELLPWDPQDDLEFDDDFVLSKTPSSKRSIVSDVMTSGQQRSNLKFTKQGVPCEDSDSDLEDFHHVLDQSELALKLADQSLRKKRRNPFGTGMHPNPAKYDEIIETYETNKRCLESICQHLKSDDVTEQDVKRVQELMYEWEKLYTLAQERHSQSKFLSVVVDTMLSAQALVVEAEKLLPFDRFTSADELAQTITLLQEKQIALEEKAQQLEEKKQQLEEFSALHPSLPVDKYKQEVTRLYNASTSMAKKVCEHGNQLDNNQAVWMEYLDEQQELEVFLAADRERLHKLLCQQEYGRPITKKDVLKELETLQNNMSLYESKLSTLQLMWARLTKESDHSAQRMLLAPLADLRQQLLIVSQRCRQIYQDTEDEDSVSLGDQSEFGKLAVSAAALHEVLKKPKNGVSQESALSNDCASTHASTGITRTCASWLRSLPVQVVALMLVTGLVCALDPDLLKRLTSFSLTISPELCYVNGPPTV